MEAPRPQYPVALRRARLSGSGVFRLFLGVDGRVSSIKVAQSTGHKELDIEAMKPSFDGA